MTGEPARPTVTISSRPLWRIRLTREVPRYLLCAMALVGIVASARYALAPPRAPALPAPQRLFPVRDPAAEGYAVLFARRYLTWNADDPQSSARALASFAGSGIEQDAGLQLPPSGREGVQWAEVVQARAPSPAEHVYTVAAQTDSAGLLYLTVSVERTPSGSLALAAYPAFVGAPAAVPARPRRQLREVGDPALTSVVERALRNYLAVSPGELAADLANGAQVSLPTMALTLDSLQHLDSSADGRSVLAVVQAQDQRGVQYTLAYELDVALRQGRWEVSAVQMNPDEQP